MGGNTNVEGVVGTAEACGWFECTVLYRVLGSPILKMKTLSTNILNKNKNTLNTNNDKL